MAFEPFEPYRPTTFPEYVKPSAVEIRREDTFLFIESMLALIEYHLTYDRHAGEPHNITAGVRMIGWGPGLYLSYGYGPQTRYALVYNDWFPQRIGVWLMHDHEYSVTQGVNQQRFANFHPGAAQYTYLDEENTRVAEIVLRFLIEGQRPEIAEFVVKETNNFDKGNQKQLHYTPESKIVPPAYLSSHAGAVYEPSLKHPHAYTGNGDASIPNPPPLPLEEMYREAMGMVDKPKPKTHADIPLHVPLHPPGPPVLGKDEVWVYLMDDDGHFSTVMHPAKVLNVSKEPKYQNFTTSDWIMAYLTRYAKYTGARQQAWVKDQLARIHYGAEVAVLRCIFPDGSTEDFFMAIDTPASYRHWQGEVEHNNHFYDSGEAPFRVA